MNNNFIKKSSMKKSFSEVCSTYGYDWTFACTQGLDLSDSCKKDLRNVKFPKDKDFFKRLYNSELCSCIMPSMDYIDYCFKGVKLNNVRFTDDSLLPSAFFIHTVDGSGFGTVLPSQDYTSFAFSQSFGDYIFGKNAIVPREFLYNLFRRMGFKKNLIYNCFARTELN